MISTLLLASLLLTQAPSPQRPTVKDLLPAVTELITADHYGQSFTAIDARIHELEAIELESPAAIKDWTQRITKLSDKGRKLDKKRGSFHWFEKEERGLYLVAGETGRPKGLLIAMHGGGQDSGDANTSLSAFANAAKKLDWLLICPEVLKKSARGWTDAGTEEFVVQLVDAALRTWNIDPDRVYFSGHSMGGYGTWTLGAHHADRVAGLAPSAGAPTPLTGPSGTVEDIVPGIVPNLRNVRIVIYQSDDDPRVPPIANRTAARLLDEAQKRWGGYDHEYWEVPNRQHEEAPGGMEALLDKIKSAVRDPRPKRVVWQPTLEWKRQFYWLWWDKPGRDTLIVADVDKAKNEVVVTAGSVPKGLEVLLDDALVDLKREVVVKLADKEVYRGIPKPDLGTLVKTSISGDPELRFAVRVPVVP